MFDNSSNLPCRNHIITVLGKSEVYSAKLTSRFSWILVCKNIKTVIYKIKMAWSKVIYIILFPFSIDRYVG